ncbi:hypothetical protein BT69DRAFT_413575 [Atractiella rhizophila]|nr:hypothetical protein BT69DRAFT_413575 [Atractiella rhizophila]
MIAGYPPFHTGDNNPIRLYEKILACKLQFTHHFTPLSISIVTRLLEPDCTKRLGNLSGGWQDVFDHPWFNEVDWNALWRKELPVPWRPSEKEEHFDRYDEADTSSYGVWTGRSKHGDAFEGF